MKKKNKRTNANMSEAEIDQALGVDPEDMDNLDDLGEADDRHPIKEAFDNKVVPTAKKVGKFALGVGKIALGVAAGIGSVAYVAGVVMGASAAKKDGLSQNTDDLEVKELVADIPETSHIGEDVIEIVPENTQETTE